MRERNGKENEKVRKRKRERETETCRRAVGLRRKALARFHGHRVCTPPLPRNTGESTKGYMSHSNACAVPPSPSVTPSRSVTVRSLSGHYARERRRERERGRKRERGADNLPFSQRTPSSVAAFRCPSFCRFFVSMPNLVRV